MENKVRLSEIHKAKIQLPKTPLYSAMTNQELQELVKLGGRKAKYAAKVLKTRK